MDNQIKQDLKNAQLSKDEIKVSTLRLLISELTNAKIQKGEELEDQEIIAVIRKELKKRSEAASAFKQAGRAEQADKEETEAKVLEVYLPAQISDEQLLVLVDEAIKQVGATSISDMGKVIGLVMSKVGQGADGARVSSLIKAKLN